MRNSYALPIAAACCLVAACGGAGSSKPENLVGKNIVRMENLPPGTLKAGEDIWMIPLAEPDPDGCQAYRQYSPNRETTQAFYYQRWDESFTMVKSEAACYGAKK